MISKNLEIILKIKVQRTIISDSVVTTYSFFKVPLPPAKHFSKASSIADLCPTKFAKFFLTSSTHCGSSLLALHALLVNCPVSDQKCAAPKVTWFSAMVESTVLFCPPGHVMCILTGTADLSISYLSTIPKRIPAPGTSNCVTCPCDFSLVFTVSVVSDFP